MLVFFASYLFSIFIGIGLVFGGGWTWSGVFLILGLHPLLDIAFKTYKVPIGASSADDNKANLILLGTPFFLLVFWGIALFSYLNNSGIAAVGVILSSGLVMGYMGITTAHELVHRQNQIERWLGFFILWLANYGHWGIEHVYGHHKYVATSKDASTARLNESIYFFWLRNIYQIFICSFEHEKNKTFFQSKVKISLLIQFVIAAILFLIFSWQGIVFYFSQGLVAAILLSSAEYLEHYGLLREKKADGNFEPTQDHHSWDCDYYFTNIVLVNLGFHSYHHKKPLVKYPQLPTFIGPQKLPLGYSGMILLAIFPPLFFKIMNPKISIKL